MLLTEVTEDLAGVAFGGDGSSSSEACKSSGDESDSAEHREQSVYRNGVANKKSGKISTSAQDEEVDGRREERSSWTRIFGFFNHSRRAHENSSSEARVD